MKRLCDQTLYEVIDAPLGASETEIRDACDRARQLLAPDSLATYSLMTPDEARLLETRIDEARSVLLDPCSRARYDEEILRSKLVSTGPSSPEGRPSSKAIIEDCGERGGGRFTPPILLVREVDPEPPEKPGCPKPSTTALAPSMGSAGIGWTGEGLRSRREALGLTVSDVARRTKIARHHIENLEAERYCALPARVYLRGILLCVARELRLDGQKVAQAYLDRATIDVPASKPSHQDPVDTFVDR